jgi:hypothetical protein
MAALSPVAINPAAVFCVQPADDQTLIVSIGGDEP